MAVLRRAADGAASPRSSPAPWNARTGVHEYGGGRVVGARRRAVVRRLGHPAPAPRRARRGARGRSRPSPTVPRGLRYADGDVQPRRHHAAVRPGGAPRRRARGHQHDRAAGGPRAERPRGGRRGPGLRVRPALEPRRRRLLLARVGPPRHAVGRHAPRGGRRRRPHRRGRRRRAGVGRPAHVGARRLAVVLRRPHRLLEPLPLDARGRASSRWSTSARTSASRRGCSASRCFAFLDDGRLVFSYSDGGLERLAVREPDFGRVTHARRPPHDDRPAPRPRRPRPCTSRPAPPTEVHVAVGGGRHRAPSRCVVPPRDLGLDADLVLGARADRVPDRRRRHRPRAALPADQPRGHGPRGRAAAAARDDPRRSHVGGPPDAAAVPPVLDEPRLRRRRRQLPRLHRLRPCVPRPPRRARGGSPTSRTARRCARSSSSAATPTPPGSASAAARPAASPRWPRSPSTTCSRPAPATTASPTSACWPSETHKFESRYLDGAGGARGPRPGPPTRRARRSSTPTGSTARWPCSRASTTRSCRPTRPR